MSVWTQHVRLCVSFCVRLKKRQEEGQSEAGGDDVSADGDGEAEAVATDDDAPEPEPEPDPEPEPESSSKRSMCVSVCSSPGSC